MDKPEIILQFVDDCVDWLSVGWSHKYELMLKAKEAINKGNNREEVIALLEAAGFEVTIVKGT